MEKTTLLIGRLVTCYILLCFIFIQSCKKDLLLPNERQSTISISLEEAKKYFDTNLKGNLTPSKLMSKNGGGDVKLNITFDNKQPLWEKAYRHVITTGIAVKIPIDMGETDLIVNRRTKATVPFSSLNYLLMYKDSVNKIHAEWVCLQPDSSWLYGNRGVYTGHVFVKTWNGALIKNYSYTKINSQKMSVKNRTLMTAIPGTPNNDPPVEGVGGVCLRFKRLINFCTCSDKSNCDYRSCDVCGVTICGSLMTECILCDIPSDPPTPGETPGGTGPTGPGGIGGGGGTGPGDYVPLNCNPDPEYVDPHIVYPDGSMSVPACRDIPIPTEPDVPQTAELNYEFDLSPLSSVYDPFENRMTTFGEISEFVDANPDFVDYIEANDLPPITVPVIWTQWQIQDMGDCINEFEALKIMHKDWSSSRALSTAIYHTYQGKFHFALDLLGMIPVYGEAADIVNAAIYFVEGNHFDAALSAGAAIPIWGWVSTTGKWARTATKQLSKPIFTAAGRVAYRAVKSSKGSIRFIKLALGDFTHGAVTALKAIKPADKTLTNLSRTLLEQSAHRLKPLASSLKSKVDDIVLHTDPTGAKTEALCDELFEIDGFVKYDSKIGSNNCFDGVYIKKNASGNVQEILINEAKQVSAVGNMRLSPANPNTGLKTQMSDAWIRDVIAQLKTNSSTSALGNTLETLFQNNRNLFTKTVTGVDRSSGEIIIAKLEKY